MGYPVLRRVIVNTKTDKAFRGVLWRERDPFLWMGGYLVLRNAELLREREPGGNPVAVPMDGEVVIPAGNVDFLQVVGDSSLRSE